MITRRCMSPSSPGRNASPLMNSVPALDVIVAALTDANERRVRVEHREIAFRAEKTLGQLGIVQTQHDLRADQIRSEESEN